MTEKNTGEKLLYCSFCGKSQHEVRKLIAGPSVFICDECIELCNDIIREETSTDKSGKVGNSDLPTPREICDILDEYVIGQEMAKRAHAFGMPIIVWSRRFATGRQRVGDQEVPMELARSPQDVAARCDVLSVHLALNAETRGLVNASVLDALRPGSYFINTARGEVVDYAALERAVRERNLRVGLDVFAAEPSTATGDFKEAIVALQNVYGTHHIGASTDQAQDAIAAETVRIVASYKDTGKVPNVVNLAKKTPATHMLVVRHRDRPGVLAHVFDHLRNGNINVQETENVIFEGAQAAVARINLDGAPSEALLKQIQDGNSDILDLHLVTI